MVYLLKWLGKCLPKKGESLAPDEINSLAINENSAYARDAPRLCWSGQA